MRIKAFCDRPSRPGWSGLTDETKAFFLTEAESCLLHGRGKLDLANSIIALQDPTEDSVRFEIVNEMTPVFKTQLARLLKSCWGPSTLDQPGRWFAIYKAERLVAAGLLDTNNTLWNLCTAKGHRGHGYAGSLVKNMLDRICDESGEDMYLFVNKDSPKAWYERLGFEVVVMTPEETGRLGAHPGVQKMKKSSCRKRSAMRSSAEGTGFRADFGEALEHPDEGGDVPREVRPKMTQRKRAGQSLIVKNYENVAYL